MKMQNLKISTVLVSFAAIIFFSACKKESAESENEEEVITTMNVQLTEKGTGTKSVFTFRDKDGEGGSAPSNFDKILLKANTEYSATIELLNESVSQAIDISAEVKAEAEDHQFFYVPAGIVLTINNFDKDAKSQILGISSTWKTGAVGTGKLLIVLKHKPGLKGASDPISLGDTDIELNFDCEIK